LAVALELDDQQRVLVDGQPEPSLDLGNFFGMTGSIADREVADFIAERYGERAAGLAPLGAGEWSRAFAVQIDGKAMVARFGAYADDFAKDELMGRRHASELPIPMVTELDEAPGGYFALSERATGGFIDALDQAALRRVLPAFLRALDAIRDLTTASSIGFGGWTPDCRAPHRSWSEALLAIARESPRVPGWRRALADSATGFEPFAAGYARLTELVTELPTERHVIHDDLLNRNVLVDAERITAVLDWGNAMYGDHLYDAAWLVYWWPWYPDWAGIDIRAELAAHWDKSGGQPDNVERRLLAYQLHIGLDAMAYTAFKGHWDEVAQNAQQVMDLVDASFR
jgi:hygromycin-B 4-O-kinase